MPCAVDCLSQTSKSAPVAAMKAHAPANNRELGARLDLTSINGQPGTLNFDREGQLVNVFVFDVAGGVIQAIRSIINPDKLAHLGYPLSGLGRKPPHHD
jgi:hypothetical protein